MTEEYRARKARNYQDWRERNPASYLWHHTRGNAIKKGIPFELPLSWVESHLVAGKCEVTGLQLVLVGEYHVGRKHPFRPTIDRHDNSKGYTPENCRLVCWIYNLAKADWTDNEVRAMARALIGVE